MFRSHLSFRRRGVRAIACSSLAAATLVLGVGTPCAQDEEPPTVAECMQECLDEYLFDVSYCGSSCMECVQWIGPICVVKALDTRCYTACIRQAKADLAQCEARCADRGGQ